MSKEWVTRLTSLRKSYERHTTNRDQNNVNHAPQVLSAAVPVIFLDCLPKSHNMPLRPRILTI